MRASDVCRIRRGGDQLFVCIQVQIVRRTRQGDGRSARTQDAILDHISGLHDLDDGALGHVLVFDLEHGLMPVGIEALAAAIQEEKSTLEDVHEPYLLQAGYLDRTARGRQITPKALEHFGMASNLFPLDL